MNFISSDHAGFLLKQKLIPIFSLTDLGCFSDEKSVDYPDFAHKLCEKIGTDNFGILICGSGLGMAISANRYSHIRACVCVNEEMARLARSHNNSNVLCLGARLLDEEKVMGIVKTFLNTNFEGGRHKRRLDKL